MKMPLAGEGSSAERGGRRPSLTRFLAAFGAALLSLAALNFLFHQVVAADFFDRQLNGVTLPVRALGPVWPGLVYIMSAVAMVAFAARGATRASRRRGAVFGGGFVGLLTFGTWNFINLGWLPHWPVAVVVVDTSWHVVCGLLSGAVLAWALPEPPPP
jgi:uncharacterized membrane protein